MKRYPSKMQHVAIMSKQFGDLINKILIGAKTVESRWSRKKIAPWGKVHPGDIIYFKNPSKPVTAKALVEKVVSISNLDAKAISWLIHTYKLEVSPLWAKDKKYSTLIFLKNPQKVKPFNINKSGFGSAAAWLCLEDIQKIKIQ